MQSLYCCVIKKRTGAVHICACMHAASAYALPSNWMFLRDDMMWCAAMFQINKLNDIALRTTGSTAHRLLYARRCVGFCVAFCFIRCILRRPSWSERYVLCRVFINSCFQRCMQNLKIQFCIASHGAEGMTSAPWPRAQARFYVGAGAIAPEPRSCSQMWHESMFDELKASAYIGAKSSVLWPSKYS